MDLGGDRLGGLRGVEWIHLAQDRDGWWAVVNMVMDLWVLAPCSYFITGYRYSLVSHKVSRVLRLFSDLFYIPVPSSCSRDI
jgi:hypothetical protein